MSCSTPSGGLRKQIVSQLCVLNIDNTSDSLINFFAKKNQISSKETINHRDEIKSKIENNASLIQGQTVLGNITKRSSKIIKHIDDNKVKAVFSDISILNDGIMKKVNEQEGEDLIRKISKMTVGMDPLTVKKIFEEVEEKNNNEIDPVELAKIKKLISNMFDYKGNPLSNQSSAQTGTEAAIQNASNMVINKVKSKATNMAKSAFAKKMGLQNTSNMQKQMIAKVATSVLKGGKSKTHKNKRKNFKNTRKNKKIKKSTRNKIGGIKKKFLWVVKNTEYNIKRFIVSAAKKTDMDGLNNLIIEIKPPEGGGEGFYIIEWNAEIDPETNMPVKEPHREFKKFHPSHDPRIFTDLLFNTEYVQDDQDLSSPDITTTLVDDEEDDDDEEDEDDEAFRRILEFVNNLSSDDSDDDY